MHSRTREILTYLDAQRALLRSAFEAVPVAWRERSTEPSRWSAAGIIEHLAIVEGRVAGRLSAMLAEAKAAGLAPESSTDPMLPKIDLARIVNRGKRFSAPESAHPTGLPAEAAWSALERSGQAVREAITAGDGLALGTLSMPHPVFGPLSLYEWFATIGAHEARHAAQIREIADAANGHGTANAI